MSPLIKLAASSRLHDATHYVLCPFAGGGSGAFRHWRTLSLENEVISVMLYPGREFRIDDPTVINIGTLAEEMIQALKT
ncbi:thioesterase, partial [Vibrio anguillarum]